MDMDAMDIDAIKLLLNSDDFGDRLRGVNQLRQIDQAIAFELIQPLVKDSQVRVRYAAVSQLDTLGGQDLITTYTLLRERLLEDPEPDVQAAAADALGALQMQEAFPDLEQLYRQSNEWLVKFSIIATLGELGDARAFPLLEEAIISPNELIKMAAIGSFGELGDAQAVPLLLPLAADSDWQTRYRIAEALKKLGGEDAIATLKILAQDSVEQVANAAKIP